MKETLYTIPLTDAFLADDECPFCNIERKLEHDALDYILGSASAYMQSDIREQTNKLGFCRRHYKDMFQYGNALGNAIMLTSYFAELNEQFQKNFPIRRRRSQLCFHVSKKIPPRTMKRKRPRSRHGSAKENATVLSAGSNPKHTNGISTPFSLWCVPTASFIPS